MSTSGGELALHNMPMPATLRELGSCRRLGSQLTPPYLLCLPSSGPSPRAPSLIGKHCVVVVAVPWRRRPCRAWQEPPISSSYTGRGEAQCVRLSARLPASPHVLQTTCKTRRRGCWLQKRSRRRRKSRWLHGSPHAKRRPLSALQVPCCEKGCTVDQSICLDHLVRRQPCMLSWPRNQPGALYARCTHPPASFCRRAASSANPPASHVDGDYMLRRECRNGSIIFIVRPFA